MLRERGVKAEIVSYDTNPEGVSQEIKKRLEDASDCGSVLLITFKAFVNLPYFPERKNWRVIVDEIPPVY